MSEQKSERETSVQLNFTSLDVVVVVVVVFKQQSHWNRKEQDRTLILTASGCEAKEKGKGARQQARSHRSVAHYRGSINLIFEISIVNKLSIRREYIALRERERERRPSDGATQTVVQSLEQHQDRQLYNREQRET